MKIKQLSLFLENNPGALSRPVRLLAQAGYNILTLSIADTSQFGILRLILRDGEPARALLEKNGFVVKVTDLVAVGVDDRPGGLAEVLEVVETAGLNVEYVYALTEKRGGRAILAFRFADPDAALRMLRQHGVNVLTGVDPLAGAEAGSP